MQPRLLSSPLRRAGASLLRQQTDERLVALARDGHDQAFAVIVQRYRPALERYCAQIVGPSRAEDAVQQTFVNAHVALGRDDRDIALQGWLYRIAHNVSLNVLRRDRPTDVVADPHDAAGPATHTHAHAIAAADAAAGRERLRETFAAIAALPDSQRDALVMREIEGRSHDEIAAALGVSAGAARQHLLRARRALRSAVTALTPYPIASFAAGGAAAAGGIAAGTGGALLAKSGAGLAAAALAVGGVVGGTHVVHREVRAGAAPATARAAAPQAASPAAPDAAPVATTVTSQGPSASRPASRVAPHHRRDGRGRGHHEGGSAPAAAPERAVTKRGEDGGHGAGEHGGERGREAETEHRSPGGRSGDVSRGDGEDRSGSSGGTGDSGSGGGSGDSGSHDGGTSQSGTSSTEDVPEAGATVMEQRTEAPSTEDSGGGD